MGRRQAHFAWKPQYRRQCIQSYLLDLLVSNRFALVKPNNIDSADNLIIAFPLSGKCPKIQEGAPRIAKIAIHLREFVELDPIIIRNRSARGITLRLYD